MTGLFYFKQIHVYSIRLKTTLLSALKRATQIYTARIKQKFNTSANDIFHYHLD